MTQPSIDPTNPTMPVASGRSRSIHKLHQKERSKRNAARKRAASQLNCRKLAGLDQPNEFIPFGMGEPSGARVLANSDALVGDLNFRAFRAVRAKGELDRFHLWISFLVAHVGHPTVCSHYRGKRDF